MKIKKLSMIGFKSFMDKLDIVFPMGTESLEIAYTATATGDQMSGSGSGAMGSFTFTATRNPGVEGGIQ